MTLRHTKTLLAWYATKSTIPGLTKKPKKDLEEEVKLIDYRFRKNMFQIYITL